MGLLFTVFTLILGILGYQLNRTNQQIKQQQLIKRETKEETTKDVKLQTQLDYISKGVDDIRIDLKANEKQMAALGERVTRVEESSKQAHKRIDKIEGNE